ncbi:hypothetical protein IGI04_026503 [Brassica rapa subsp. trilocularis]|uniref:ABC transmembrane type-1 domain-containing protein n=1 Tax=Brassica rapa subsp. trilocularis TaxID=1813537 RepID=A0ABQ7KWU0_BRACM|nr:hypothetical protein IGI04_026503 [Brassica rapa subsp. trilocularis]
MVEAVLCGALFLLWNGSGLGRIGLALGGATVLSLFLDPYGATFKICGIDLLDTDIQLVSSQAATVDNRGTKLLETVHSMYLSISMVLLRALLSALRGFIATYLIWRLGSPTG